MKVEKAGFTNRLGAEWEGKIFKGDAGQGRIAGAKSLSRERRPSASEPMRGG